LSELRVLPLAGLPAIGERGDLGALVASAAALEDGDVVVLAQKIVSKAEGRVVRLDDLAPSDRARELATDEVDARHIEAILRESKRIVRTRPGFVIAETQHGFVCASAGVDASNAPAPGTLVLLPLDPDASARSIRARLAELTGRTVAVVVSDSFGSPWPQATTDVAIGVSGLVPLLDLRGTRDASGYELRSTQIAVADELAGAAELVMRKADGVPGAVIRGFEAHGDGTARELVMPAQRDLFR
jgi:coenzyme F420-0:L-glutamate ligase / coenzyme F420-1:gamma-L-glutamate ligase